ncbi:MAG TPA: ATP-binding protein [Candidatus Kapabacteria bacterium]|nr:ATP-binding protein [Candidatus Kapabacteria bacterium]
MNAESLKIVRALPLFSKLADDELGCLDGAEIVEYREGDVIAEDGAPARYFYVTMEGEISFHRMYGNQEILMGVSRPGTFMGEMFILLDIPWISTARAVTDSRLLRMASEDFWRMLGSCHCVTREVLRTAATRLRNIEGYSHQREKLVSLGTMAAGLAHELNNPAAAARRATSHLRETVEQLECLTCNLSKKFSPENWQVLLDAEESAAKQCEAALPSSMVERSDLEEQLASWLDANAIAEAWKLAPTFASASLSSGNLKQLADRLPGETRNDAFSWLESQLTLRSLLREVEESTGRIGDLVKAMKSYTYMDRGPVQEVDIHEGINNTLTILKHKMKNARLETRFAQNLPRIQARGGELNQVWTNLIDNAIHATNGAGRITVTTRAENSHVVVEIADNGTGIPSEIQNRIFEPFFTTKGVGSGTGLGLVISHRIVADGHGGEIEFESEPGNTVFKIRLPTRLKGSTHN